MATFADRSESTFGIRVGLRAMAVLWAAGGLLGSCSDHETRSPTRAIATRIQALVDTDSDGMEDDWETTHFGNLSRNGAGDYEADGILDLEEFLHGFDPTVADGFEDADGDRYPNVFEIRASSDPNDDSDQPTPTYVVNAAGGADFTNISAAVNAASLGNGVFQIILVAPGTYAGSTNCNVNLSASKPRVLILGAGGAATTIIDCAGASSAWYLYRGSVLASLTFRRFSGFGLYVSTTEGMRLVDLVVRNNTTSFGFLFAPSLSKLSIVGSTFYNNTGTNGWHHLNFSTGQTQLINSVFWNPSGGGTSIYVAGSATLTAQNSLSAGMTLSGADNLSGATNPLLRSDGRLLPGSPLLGAGASGPHSLFDMDLELRASPPDIGADQWIDDDADDLPDAWELTYAANLTVMSATEDDDDDGLTNLEELIASLDPLDPDSDGDGLSDGDELNLYETNPSAADTEADGMPDGWEADHGLNPLVDDSLADDDGDRYPNIYEYEGDSDPSDAEDQPPPTYVVNAAGGGNFTNVAAAVAAASTSNGVFQIVVIEAGLYKGSTNCAINVGSNKPRLLLIGKDGAAATIVDCGGSSTAAWFFGRGVVVASLTLRGFGGSGFYVVSSEPVVLSDMVLRDNPTVSGMVRVSTVPKLSIIGSTLINNTGSGANHLSVTSGQALLVNTVIWSASGGTAVYLGSNATLSGKNSLVGGMTLAGTNNLPGSTNPSLRLDARLMPDSPLLAAGSSGPYSLIDQDGEVRASPPDIGADQWVDVDEDDLPDGWELRVAGSLAILEGADFDADGLEDLDEYAIFDGTLQCDPLDPDTDQDLVGDGLEVELGTNPLVRDSDLLTGDTNEDGVIDAIGLQLGYLLTNTDDDGDGLTNAQELSLGTDPTRADTDGDLVPDGEDAFPHDPWASSMPTNVEDLTPPIITLILPASAVEL